MLADRPNSALLVIDVQVNVVGDAYKRDETIAKINLAVAQARNAEVSVIWVQHSDEWMAIDSDDWQIVPELTPLDGEPKVFKTFRSSFEQTDLEHVLANLHVGHLYISGAQTNNCIRHTIHSALERGYDITLIEDAHTTSDFKWDNGPVPAQQVIDEQNANLHEYALPNRTAQITPAAKVFTK